MERQPVLTAAFGRVFHVKHKLQGLATFAGLAFDDGQWGLLERYGVWLETEALPAGGIGPAEAPRIIGRHIGDSLAYAWVLGARPRRLVDYGSGVGLPGIPLAIAWPATECELIDRSGRRVELMERAVHVLGLENVTVFRGDVQEDDRLHDAIVTRALFPADRWVEWIGPRLAVGGKAVTSLGGAETPATAGGGVRLGIHSLPPGMLDHSVTFLMMTRENRE